MYRLFDNNTDVLGTWPSLESCQSQARVDNHHDVRWEEPAPTGPQGNARHWYGFSEKRIRRDGFMQPEREYLIVEWPALAFKLIDFEDGLGCGPVHPHEAGYETLDENEVLYLNGGYPVYSAYKKKDQT
jgi:hypothetical protein